MRNTILSIIVLALLPALFPHLIYAEEGWVKTSINSNFISVIENSPWGILAGEFDTRIWLNPPNDIYFSQDQGQTWITLGLSGKGIKDIKYYGGKIYAATFYVRENKIGLFVSEGLSKSWRQIGPMISPTKVDRDSKTIYFGGENHGLWISQDEGTSWTQKLGDGSGWYGPNIKGMGSSEKVTFVSTLDKVYKTLDNGSTWTEIPALANKGIISFNINGNVVFAGSSGTVGLYRSLDLGVTWVKVSGFGNNIVGDITYVNKRYYAGRLNSQSNTFTVFQSSDLGNTWTDTGLNMFASDRVVGLTWLFSNPSNVFALVLNKGLFRYAIPKEEMEKLPLLNTPWEETGPNDFIDKITAYFDHEYPLLGYGYYTEPEPAKNTTLNFFGTKESEPKLYYSTHNGTDYALNLGTPILAPADGIASFYYCSSCGNSIRIDHLNGYQSIYMHLQKSSLFVTSGSAQISTGEQIGKVGMTGNTNGPHLHFEIIKDGKYPDGLVDPYGWQSLGLSDPWPVFTWTDTLGNHQGSKSIYLWKLENPSIMKLLSGSGNAVLDNKVIKWDKIPSFAFTISLRNYLQPKTDRLNLGYISNTSTLINAYDYLGNEMTGFSEPAEITFDLSKSNLTDVVSESIKVYFWNEITRIWEALPSVLDFTNNTVKAQTKHLSNFAVFAEKIDSSPPQTQIILSGSQEGRWFLEYPAVSFQTFDSESSPIKTFYTTSGEDSWEEFTEPFRIEKDGVTNLQYRSQDLYGNLEETQSHVIQVDTKNKGKKSLIISRAKYEVPAQIN